jgi:hypothetical protein
MKTDRRTFPLRTLLAFGLLACVGAHTASAQTAPAQGECKVVAAQVAKDEAPPAPGLTSGIRIKVLNGKTPIQRKRFYLLERSVREGTQPDWSKLPSRAEYLKGTSKELQEWLRNCDSLYCPKSKAEYEAAIKTVPEFVKAYEAGRKKYKNHRLALEWVTVNFPLKNVRTAFYERKRDWLEQAAVKAGKVTSAMTDEKGEAYFLGVKPGDYYVSNIFPLEAGNVLWDCKVNVPPPVPARLHSVSVDLGYPKATDAAPAK